MSPESPAHNRPRVAVVAHDVHWEGGQERALAEMIDRLCDHVEFHVVSGSLDGRLAGRVEWHRVRGLRRPFALWFPWFWIRATRILNSMDTGLVHSCGAIHGARSDLVMLQFSHHGYVAHTGSWTPPGVRGVRWLQYVVLRAMALVGERWCYRPSRLRMFAAVSPRTAEEARTHHVGIGVQVVPNGVDLDRFKPDARARADLRNEMGISDAVTLVLFVGGDWERKGLAPLIEALPDLDACVHLWVVGSGDTASYKTLAERCGVRGRVRFVGPRTDVERWYAAADVFCLPTEYETFSMVTYEAAASGLPIVATRVAGIEDLIVDGETGWFVDQSAESIAERLRDLNERPAAGRAMGLGASVRAQDYGWGVVADRTLDLYERLSDAP